MKHLPLLERTIFTVVGFLAVILAIVNSELVLHGPVLLTDTLMVFGFLMVVALLFQAGLRTRLLAVGMGTIVLTYLLTISSAYFVIAMTATLLALVVAGKRKT